MNCGCIRVSPITCVVRDLCLPEVFQLIRFVEQADSVSDLQRIVVVVNRTLREVIRLYVILAEYVARYEMKVSHLFQFHELLTHYAAPPIAAVAIVCNSLEHFDH